MPKSNDQITNFENSVPNDHCTQQQSNQDGRYFDINHLAELAQEQSYTLPRGLNRDQIVEWAANNLKQ